MFAGPRTFQHRMSAKTEVLTFGLVLFQVFTDQPNLVLFKHDPARSDKVEERGESETFRKFQQGFRPEYPADVPVDDEAKKLIDLCLSHSEQKRPSFDQVCTI